MATDLATRQSPSKSETYLQRTFADLAARIRRVDVVRQLLFLALVLFTYALFSACLDRGTGSSTGPAVQAVRWSAFAGFLGVFGFLTVQTARAMLRHVSPYFIARQLEANNPDAKNSLINWLDLHEQPLPQAFQVNLSAVAAEHLRECDLDTIVPRRQNRMLLGGLGVLALPLAILFLLGPSAFLASMLRAFVPFYAPTPAPLVTITLLEPVGGDAEIGPGQSVNFAVRIDGRVPTGREQPTLHYRWNADDDFLPLPLQSEGGGVFSTLLSPVQLRAGIAYKISAGDAETPTHQIRTRPAAHVRTFEIKYEHRPFRGLKSAVSVFPDEKGTRPIIQGPIGSAVELTIHASRPVQSASVAVANQSGRRELPVRIVPDNPRSFTCRFTLEKPGEFRVSFTTPDGEENVDRDGYPILVTEDDAPKVTLTQPGSDVSLPENGTLVLAGSAISPLGVKALTLKLRAVAPTGQPTALSPQPFRPGVSFERAGGGYPVEIEYQDFIALDQLKDTAGAAWSLRAGHVIEYWLEAADASDYPHPTGNIGKSPAYKITLLPKAKDAAQEKSRRDAAIVGQKKFQQRQDQASKNGNAQPNGNGGGGGPSDPHKALEKIQKQQSEANQKLESARQEQQQDKQRGQSKGAEQKNSEKKDGPQEGGNGSAPQPKPAPMAPPDDAGANKEQGDGPGKSGESRGDGSPEQKKNDGSDKGERKDGPKDGSTPGKGDGGMGKKEQAGNAKDGGGTGAKGPDLPKESKDNPSNPDAPQPAAKNDPFSSGKKQPSPGDAKGIEQNGPQMPNKDQAGDAKPPQPGDARAKPGQAKDGDANGEPKDGPAQEANAGQARGDAQNRPAPQPSLDELARQIQNLSRDDQAGQAAGKAFARAAKSSDDPNVRDIAREALVRNGRDPKTGEKTKAPNPYGSKPGESPGIADDIKAAAANREFAARIGQMQLESWKRILTPDLLRKAGMTEADWRQYVKNQETHDALVRQLNADAARKLLKELGGGQTAGTSRTIDGQSGNDALRGVNAPPPLEIRDAQRRQAERDERDKR